jgi:hypothetical protein
MKTTLKAALLTTVLAVAGSAAYAQDAAAPAADAAPAPAAAPAGPTLAPSMGGLAANASPYSVDLSAAPVLGDLLGKVYITGALSGFAQYQNHGPGAPVKSTVGDLTNGQVIIQKVDGVVQYYVQAGVYSFPYVGGAYVKATTATPNSFGPVPQAYIKIAPTSSFSIEGGKLPTLIGDEYTFGFQNLNIQRGLLWNQEPAVSQGFQANYTMGPVALSAAFTDGLYSGHLNTISGLAAWTIDSSNTLAFAASIPTSKYYKGNPATFLLQNNQDIYNVIYTFTSGPLMLSPYIQYAHVPTLALNGTTSTNVWAGALLAKYTIDPNFSVAVRGEYIGEGGSAASASADAVGYGIGSDAWSATITPTYQYNVFFLRAEASYVHASSKVFGTATNPSNSQFRLLAETGVVF